MGASRSSPPSAEDPKAAKRGGEPGDLRSSVIETRMPADLKHSNASAMEADLPQELAEELPSFPVRDWLQTHAKLQCHLRASKVKSMKVIKMAEGGLGTEMKMSKWCACALSVISTVINVRWPNLPFINVYVNVLSTCFHHSSEVGATHK